MDEFSKKLKAARKAARLTQTALAENTLIPFRTIQDWEGGKHTPPEYVQRLVLNELRAIAEVK